ncbi:MAG: hypothetical protein ACP5HM_15325 [Anaerolineae bacterium]
MVANRIQAEITQEDQQAVLDILAEIRERLPFLLNLTAEERQALPKMGEKSRAFVDEALALVREDPDLLPADFEVEELEKDIALYDRLQPILFAVLQLEDLLLSTTVAASSDAYSAALAIYERAQEAGKGETLAACLAEIEKAAKRSGDTSSM